MNNVRLLRIRQSEPHSFEIRKRKLGVIYDRIDDSELRELYLGRKQCPEWSFATFVQDQVRQAKADYPLVLLLPG